MPDPLPLTGDPLTIDEIVAVARDHRPVTLDEAALDRVKASRAHVERLVEEDAVVYGVTTGLGDLKHETIAHEDAVELQENLLASHACGTGDLLPGDVVRAMMILRAGALAKGHSGVRPVVIETLVAALNAGLVPAVYEKGSVGSSGDLVPLAHLARALTGDGEVVGDDGSIRPADQALEAAGIPDLQLRAKEGLALINGTQLQGALAALLVHDARRLLATSCAVGAMSVEGLRGSRWPFDHRLAEARAHPGHRRVAQAIEACLDQSDIMKSHEGCDKVQDPYSFRCIPQVHGAVLDAIEHLGAIVEREAGSANDNPLIFPEDDLVISGGNFHGEPLGLPLAYVTAAVAKLGVASERRIAHLVMGHDTELPPFLTEHGGLNSGLMIPQYVAASLVNENKSLAYPVVADSVPTSGNQEDVNAMGATQALHARRALANVQHIVGIEALVAAQAIDFHAPREAGIGAEAGHQAVRQIIDPLGEDRYQRPDLEQARELVASGRLLAAVEQAIGGPLLAS